MGVAVAMIIIGFVNMFKIVSILSAKAQIIMLTSFIVYQM
jgi:hypothetical protein